MDDDEVSFDFKDLGVPVGFLIGVEDYPLPSFSPRGNGFQALVLKVYTKTRLIVVALGYYTGYPLQWVVVDVAYF